MFVFPTLFALFGTFTMILVVTAVQSPGRFIELAYQVVITVLHGTIWLLGKRFKDQIVYMIPVLYIVMHLLIQITLETLQLPWVDGHIPIAGMLVRMCAPLAIYSLLLAPRVSYVLCCYLPVFLANIIYTVIRHSEVKAEFMTTGVYMIVMVIPFWYILQYRELQRFFQQQVTEQKELKAIYKETQVKKVLDSQPDAVIIFSTNVDIRYPSEKSESEA